MKLVQIPALGCDHGLYEGFDAALSPAIMASTCVAVADRMEKCVAQVLAQAPEQFVLMGTSFGARVAMEVTLAAAARVPGLILIGSGPGPALDPAAGLKRGARARGGEFEAVLNEMGDMISHLPGPRGAETMAVFRVMSRLMGPDKFAQQSDAMAHRADLWPRMQEITCPVLCLWGAQDQFAPVAIGHKIAAAVPDGQCVVLENCGHFPTLEYPKESAEIVAAFLSGLS